MLIKIEEFRIYSEHYYSLTHYLGWKYFPLLSRYTQCYFIDITLSLMNN